jgi:photosystem II stability/assembly factor-like uncharacterized protein
MSNDTSGWGIEIAGHIMHSVDGSRTWKDVTPSQGSYSSGGFFTLDENRAWAISELLGCYTEGCSPPPNFAIIWRTDDGGRKWLPSQPLCLVGDCGYDYDAIPEYFHPIAMQFLDNKTGWMLVTVQHVMMQDRWRVYMTVDGGKTWAFQSDNLFGPMVFLATGLAFLDKQNGWFSSSNVRGANDPIADWSIYQTKDAGQSWENNILLTPSTLPKDFAQNTPWCGAANVSTIPPNVVDLTIYCDIYGLESRPRYLYYYHSSDSGRTWRSFQVTGSVQFINTSTGWRLEVLGQDKINQVQQTHDGGVTWSTLKNVIWDRVQFSFISDQVGWAIAGIGDASALIKTLDSGRTWNEIKPVVAP